MGLLKSNRGKIVIWIIVLVVLFIAGGILIYQKVTSKGVSLELKAPEGEVIVGKPFDLEVLFSNNSANSLNNVRIIFNLPGDIIAADGNTQSIITRELGDIKSNSTHREALSVIAAPKEEPNYKPSVTVLYLPTSLTAEFKKTADAEVKVKNPNFNLEFSAPEKIFSGEEFDTEIIYRAGGDVSELSNLELQIEYPDNFQIISTEPKIDENNKFWKIENPEEENRAKFRGKIDLPDASSFDLGAHIVMRILDKEYKFLSVKQTVDIEPSPLSFSIFVPEKENTIVYPGDRLTYVLSYKNNTNVALQDVVLRAQLIGEMFDFGSLDTGANFDGLTNTITWTSNSFSELRKVDAGKDGQASFTVGINSQYPIRKLSDKNYIVKVNARIESPTVPSSINTDKTLNTAKLEYNVAGKLLIKTGALFRDAASGIVNSGPFPPRVGTPTNYTIHWDVTNFGTDVDAIEVRAFLEPGVRFIKPVSNNTGEQVLFDSGTGDVVWRVGRLVATTGVLGEKPEAIFQIEAIPPSAFIGKYFPLLQSTRIQGRDEFNDVTIYSEETGITTRLEADPTIKENSGLVIN
jgi:hypothetical protein